MKKFIKGFTLIELIIVMAVMSILMLGIMQMMKPIRSTYVDSTYYESQRNTQNGMVTYLTESLRYATRMGIYQTADLSSAVTKFENAGYSQAEYGKINVIVIDNATPYSFNGATSYGRILRNKKDSDSATRLALGEAYYGKYTYSINVEPTGFSNADGSFTGLKVTVSSLLPSSVNTATNAGKNNTQDISGYKCVSTEGEVSCLNLKAPVNGWTNASALYDSSGKKMIPTTTKNKNTYIIFTLPTD